jgi:integrase
MAETNISPPVHRRQSGKTFGFLPRNRNVERAAATAAAQILDFPKPDHGRTCGEKPNIAKRKYLSPDEVRRVIDAAGRVGRQRERDQLLLTMMYRHGLRVSEAVDLRWTDFDIEASRDRPFWVRRVKGGKATTHTLEPDTARLLQRAKKRTDGIYVFRSERGGRLSTDIVRVICERAGQAAGFEFRVRPHMFRHSSGRYTLLATAWLISSDALIRAVQRRPSGRRPTDGRGFKIWRRVCRMASIAQRTVRRSRRSSSRVASMIRRTI